MLKAHLEADETTGCSSELTALSGPMLLSIFFFYHWCLCTIYSVSLPFALSLFSLVADWIDEGGVCCQVVGPVLTFNVAIFKAVVTL